MSSGRQYLISMLFLSIDEQRVPSTTIVMSFRPECHRTIPADYYLLFYGYSRKLSFIAIHANELLTSDRVDSYLHHHPSHLDRDLLSLHILLSLSLSVNSSSKIVDLIAKHWQRYCQELLSIQSQVRYRSEHSFPLEAFER